jgi:hypothetical protein
MSYQLLRGFGGLGAATLPPDSVVPAIAPKWPWESTTCPSGGYALRAIDLPDGKKGWFCSKFNATPDGKDPSKYTVGDVNGRTGFWTMTNTVLVGVGVSVALTIAISMIPMPKRKKQSDEDKEEAKK